MAGLRSELIAAGWAPAGIGRQWYAHRFAWTSDEAWHRVGSWLTGPSGREYRRDRPVAAGVVLREGEVHLEQLKKKEQGKEEAR